MTIFNYCSRWESGRLATIFAENTDKNILLSFTDALQFRYGEIRPKPTYELTDDLKETYRKYALVRPNDIMLNGLNLNYDFVTQRVAQVKVNGIITSAYISLRPREGVSAQYYTYLFKSLDAMKVFNGMGTGIRLTLSYNLLKNLELPVPPRAEQDQIVRYLDWQVSKINKLIAAKKKQIISLTAKKQIMVSDVITHGLNPKAEMKFSGVKWLGSVPNHWQVRKIASLFTQRNVKVSDKDYPALSVAKMGIVPQLDTAVKTNAGDNRKLVCNGDFVINSRSDRKGSCGVAKQDGSVSLINIVLTPRQEWSSHYVHYLLRSQPFSEEYYRYGRGIVADLWTTRYNEMKNIMLPVPPLDEQAQIAHWLDDHTQIIEEMMSALNKEIDTLHELRTRLISDVVTGQMDVRGIEVPDFTLVEETDEAVDEDENGE